MDIERLHRKIAVGNLNPCEFITLMVSYENINNLINNIAKNKILKSLIPKKAILDQFSDFTSSYTKIFNLDEMEKYIINDISNSIINKNICNEIDDLQKEIDNNMAIMNNVQTVLSNHINENNRKFPKKKKENKHSQYDYDDDVCSEESKIQLRMTDREGYYLSLTKNRANLLKKKLSDIAELKITNNFTLLTKNIQYKELPKGNTKLFIEEIDIISNNIIVSRDKLHVS